MSAVSTKPDHIADSIMMMSARLSAAPAWACGHSITHMSSDIVLSSSAAAGHHEKRAKAATPVTANAMPSARLRPSPST